MYSDKYLTGPSPRPGCGYYLAPNWRLGPESCCYPGLGKDPWPRWSHLGNRVTRGSVYILACLLIEQLCNMCIILVHTVVFKNARLEGPSQKDDNLGRVGGFEHSYESWPTFVLKVVAIRSWETLLKAQTCPNLSCQIKLGWCQICTNGPRAYVTRMSVELWWVLILRSFSLHFLFSFF